LGVDPVTGIKKFDAYIARILGFEDPEGKAMQFSAAELRNFTDALQEIAKQVAAYTGLPPQYLSARSDNPASAEAIRAAESRLVKTVERKNKVFGGAWESAMRVAYLMMNGGSEVPPEYYRMESIWRDPSTPTYAAKADAAAKLYANGLGVIPKERARMDIGYSVAEREEMKRWDEEENPLGLLGAMATPAPNMGNNPAPPGSPGNTAPKPTDSGTAP
jgi:Phage portal protein, SPP1 Gp6-like